MMLYALATYMLLKSLYDVVKGYIIGGPDAPDQLVFILSIILMGGGSLLCLIFIFQLWKTSKKEAAAMAEAAAAMESAENYEDQINAELEFNNAVKESYGEVDEFSDRDHDDSEEEDNASFSDSVN